MPPKKSWNKGAQSAYKGFVDTYGPEQGEKVFYATANRIAGKGEGSINKTVNAAYRTGGKQKR
jgi:hypothetical protein